jgi:hypothetical protein
MDRYFYLEISLMEYEIINGCITYTLINDSHTLKSAVRNNNTSQTKFLLDSGAEEPNSDYFLHHASCYGYESIVHLLLKSGADVNLQEAVS